MNDFDRFLEIELRAMLDPMTERRPPRRGRRAPVLQVEPAGPEIGVDLLPGRPAAIPVPVTRTL
jgi:hypothetical protein